MKVPLLNQRPTAPVIGEIRYNTTTSDMETWDGKRWMGLNGYSNKNYYIINDYEDETHKIVDVRQQVMDWIFTTQSVSEWKYHNDMSFQPGMIRIYVSDRLLTIMGLKWS